jgi:hypothetical protein
MLCFAASLLVHQSKDFNTENYHNNVPVWDYRKAFFAVYFPSAG